MSSLLFGEDLPIFAPRRKTVILDVLFFVPNRSGMRDSLWCGSWVIPTDSLRRWQFQTLIVWFSFLRQMSCLLIFHEWVSVLGADCGLESTASMVPSRDSQIVVYSNAFSDIQ
jgi:hypothetical protein